MNPLFSNLLHPGTETSWVHNRVTLMLEVIVTRIIFSKINKTNFLSIAYSNIRLGSIFYMAVRLTDRYLVRINVLDR